MFIRLLLVLHQYLKLLAIDGRGSYHDGWFGLFERGFRRLATPHSQIRFKLCLQDPMNVSIGHSPFIMIKQRYAIRMIGHIARVLIVFWRYGAGVGGLQPLHWHLNFYLIYITKGGLSGMKPMTIKQAERWLDELKKSDTTCFNNTVKLLKKFEKSEDEYECFTKLNREILNHPKLTQELNNFLEDGNKLVVNRSENDRINELIKIVKKAKPEAFEDIVEVIRDMSNNDKVEKNSDQQNQILKECVMKAVKGNKELQECANKALNYQAKNEVMELNLKHLKRGKAHTKPAVEAEPQVHEHPRQCEESRVEHSIAEDKAPRVRIGPPFLNQNQEKNFLGIIEESIDYACYETVVKLIHLYGLGIIAKEEINEQVAELIPRKQLCEGLKDILESRELDKRKNCPFKPLNDINFVNADRATPSYVRMPLTYPCICSGSTPQADQVLNRSWVSVPHGTEDHFNIRIKNMHEENLLRSEDNRYEFDLYTFKLKSANKLIEQSIEKLENNSTADVSANLDRLISLKVIQMNYKNATKQLKEEIEYHLKSSPLPTLNILLKRVQVQMEELEGIRNVHALKVWMDTASKNHEKAKDIKGYEFKREEKIKMKPNYFIEELRVRVLQLTNNAHEAPSSSQDISQFFTIFNSFSTVSRKEKCQYRKLPEPQIFNNCQTRIPLLLPIMILAFEDKEALSLSYTMASFFLRNTSSNPDQDKKSRSFLKTILSTFMGLHQPEDANLSDSFDDNRFFTEILPLLETQDAIQSQEIDEFIAASISRQEMPQEAVPSSKQSQQDIPVFYSLSSEPQSQFQCLPTSNEHSFPFYASQHFYVMVRFMYAVYERVIRVKQVTSSPLHPKLFELLFYACIKGRQSTRYEESLNDIFGQHSFIFLTFYKLVESLVKSIAIASNCALTAHSLKLLHSQPCKNSQDIYLLLINKFSLNRVSNSVSSSTANSSPNNKIIRLLFDGQGGSNIIYINSLEGYYLKDGANSNGKQLKIRRDDISDKIEMYTVMELEEQQKYRHTRDKIKEEVLQVQNGLNYHFEGSSIRIQDLADHEDILVNSRHHEVKKHMISRDLSKASAFVEHIN